jgi:glutathione S-transferase
VFDEFADLAIFKSTPKVRKWRAELARRPSVRSAVGADYPQLLRAFLKRYEAHLLKLAA